MRTAIAAALLLAAACASPQRAEPGDSEPPPAAGAPSPGGGGQVTLDFQAGQAGSASGEEQGATATGGPGQIAIRGTMQTPNPCYRLTGALERASQTITVRVTGQADPDAMCIQSIGSVPYTATVRGVAAGTYTLRVVHTYPGTGWEPAPVLETRVTVR